MSTDDFHYYFMLHIFSHYKYIDCTQTLHSQNLCIDRKIKMRAYNRIVVYAGPAHIKQ